MRLGLGKGICNLKERSSFIGESYRYLWSGGWGLGQDPPTATVGDSGGGSSSSIVINGGVVGGLVGKSKHSAAALNRSENSSGGVGKGGGVGVGLGTFFPQTAPLLHPRG